MKKDGSSGHSGCNSMRTSLASNRLILFASTIVLIVINTVIVAKTVSITSSDVLYRYIYTACQGMGNIVVLCASCLIGTAVLGFVGAYGQLRAVVKVFFALVTCFLVFNIVSAVLLAGYYHPDQLKVMSDSFRAGWIHVMDLIVAGDDEDGSLMAFVSEISTEGQCCGYDSLTSTRQNPPEAKCSTSSLATCDTYLDQYIITDSLKELLTIYSVFLAIMILNLLALLFFLVRIVPQPVYSDSPGGYYYV